MQNILYQKIDYESLLSKFYECFDTGFAFEKFLKGYLSKIGFLEVQVTKQTRDGGIDLIAKRKGIEDFSDCDSIDYFIQAKRYKPTEKISPNRINELRGVMANGSKGLFIATCNYSKSAIDNANDKLHKDRPIVLVNGIDLIRSCIKHEFCFSFTPSIDKNEINNVIENVENEFTQKESIIPELDYVEKMITSNDIRARILRLPKTIKEKLVLNSKKILVIINGIEYNLSVYNNGEYLANVTDIYKTYNLILENGNYNPKIVKMFIINGKLNIIIND